MIKKQHKYPSWATKYRAKDREVRYIGGRYYVYEYSYVYDPTKKRSRKITGKLLGRITKEDGFIESPKRRLENVQDAKCRECGLSSFIINNNVEIVERLKKAFPKEWQAIILMTYSRLKHQSPIKRMVDDFENSMLAEWFGKYPSKKAIPEILKSIGKNEYSRSEYMKNFITEDDFLLIDSTFIRAGIKKSALCKDGYNKDKIWESQTSLLYLYSKNLNEPVYYRLLAGNIRDVKSLQLTIKDAGIKNAMIIADKGFYSKENTQELINNGLDFIIPLRRNSSLIDYTGIQTSIDIIEYQKSAIRCKKTKVCNGYVYLFLNVENAGAEENQLLLLSKSHPEDCTIFDVDERKFTIGTIALFSNKDLPPEDIYAMYKMRATIEQTFDTLKTTLKADAPFMSDDDKFQGWMFINHIALQLCYNILKIIKENKLSSKISINDAIRRLSEIKKIKVAGDWYDCEQTKAELQMAELLLSKK